MYPRQPAISNILFI